MKIRRLTIPEELSAYERWIDTNQDGTLWQSLEWKHYQEALGRETRIYTLEEKGSICASALVIIDRTIFGFSTWDIPRGPLLSAEGIVDGLLAVIAEDAKNDHALSLFLSPPVPIVNNGKWRVSARREQPKATRIVDLTVSEEEILKQMHSKGRYNISVARKHGVNVSESDDIDAFYGLLTETGLRDRFTIPQKSHFEAFLRDLPGSFLLLAYPASTASKSTPQMPISGLLGASWSSQGIYYYGASKYASRALMAPYLLQWRAMQHCKSLRCSTYDLLGIQDPRSESTLRSSSKQANKRINESTNKRINDSWSGLSVFKEKFGGRVVLYPPEQELILRPSIARLLRWKRRIFG